MTTIPPRTPDPLIGQPFVDDAHDDFGGFHRDLPGLVGRRRALRWFGGAALFGVLAACSSDGSSGNGAASDPDAMDGTIGDTTNGPAATTSPETATSNTTAGTATDTMADTEVTASAGAEIPDETQGPYPADGSNGPNVLGESGIVRSDITSSIGSLSGSADGVPTTIELTVVDASTGSPLPGSAVYLWHCTAGGQYSIYEVTDQNYLRGVQVADDAGRISFETVFPGCYRGRWPHCHFEVYDSVDVATSGSRSTKTSQLALPQVDCETVYTDSRYGDSISNLAQLSLQSDNVFRDGWTDQLATVSGSVADGLTVSLLVRV